MKKIIVIMMSLILITGCNSKKEENKLVGTWSTKYELGTYGDVTQTYNINKDGTCNKTLITDMEIKQDCTYKINKDEITFIYKDDEKTYKYRFENSKLILGGYEYEKK